MPATLHLTRAGHRLYWLYRAEYGEEVTPAYLIEMFNTMSSLRDTCLCCGEFKRVCVAGFCLECMNGAVSQ